MDRRKFIGTSAVAGAAVASGTAMASSKISKSNNPKHVSEHPYNERTYSAMPTNAFGKTGYKVGILSLGGQAAIEQEGKRRSRRKDH